MAKVWLFKIIMTCWFRRFSWPSVDKQLKPSFCHVLTESIFPTAIWGRKAQAFIYSRSSLPTYWRSSSERCDGHPQNRGQTGNSACVERNMVQELPHRRICEPNLESWHGLYNVRNPEKLGHNIKMCITIIRNDILGQNKIFNSESVYDTFFS